MSNEWMSLAHMWFCLQILVHLQERQSESEPHQKTKKTNKKTKTNQHCI